MRNNKPYENWPAIVSILLYCYSEMSPMYRSIDLRSVILSLLLYYVVKVIRKNL